MDVLTAILLGAVQGLTEFFPVSSSGHLLLLERLLHFQTPALLFQAFVHMGSAVAVAVLLRKDVCRILVETGRILRDLGRNGKEFLRSLVKGTDPEYGKIIRTNYRRLVVMLCLAFLPTAVLGFLFAAFAGQLLTDVMSAGIGFFLTGMLLLVCSMLKPGHVLPKDVPYLRFILIGTAQGLAVFPGISRFAVTLSGGILSGFSKKTAIRVSFLLMIPASLGAFLFELIKSASEGLVTPGRIGTCLAGTVTAAFVGIFVIKRFLRYVQTRSLKGFAYYCIAAGILSICAAFLA